MLAAQAILPIFALIVLGDDRVIERTVIAGR